MPMTQNERRVQALLPDDVRAQVAELGNRLGLAQAATVRMLICEALSARAAHGEQLTLPPDDVVSDR